MSTGGGWFDRLVGGCIGVLVGVVALYCAVRLIESVLPALVVIVGIGALIAILVSAVVAFRMWRDRW